MIYAQKQIWNGINKGILAPMFKCLREYLERLIQS